MPPWPLVRIEEAAITGLRPSDSACSKRWATRARVRKSNKLDLRWSSLRAMVVLGGADHGVFISAGSHSAVGENTVLGNPPEGLLVNFLAIGLEHKTLARAPAPRIHLGMIALGKFLLVVVRIEIGPQIDIALGAAKRAEELAQIRWIRIAGHHGCDHEGGIDDFAETELLGEVIGSAEQGGSLRLPVNELIEPVKQHSIRERQIDLVRRHVLLERLNRRIVAAGLVAHRNGNAGEIVRRLDRRGGGNKHAGRRHRVNIRVEPAVAL